MKIDEINSYILNYIKIYESQYNQNVNYVIISGLKKSGERIASLVSLSNLNNFLSSAKCVNFCCDERSNEVILKIEILKEVIDFKIFKVSEEKNRKFRITDEKKISELKLNYLLDNLNTVKYKKNILDTMTKRRHIQ